MAAVIASAVEDAMGFRIDAMPLSPSLLFDLRRGFEAGSVESTAVGRARADVSAQEGSLG